MSVHKHRKGAPLATTEAVTANNRGRALSWRVRASDHAAVHAAAAAHGLSASDYARAIVDAATTETGQPPAPSEDFGYLSSRFTHEQIEEISRAAAAVELEPTVWLRLLTTDAGEVLLRQLRAARDTRHAPPHPEVDPVAAVFPRRRERRPKRPRKLADITVASIALSAQGLSQTEIAAKLGTSRQAVHAALKRTKQARSTPAQRLR